jgi:hypothetical protein
MIGVSTQFRAFFPLPFAFVSIIQKHEKLGSKDSFKKVM